MGKKVKKRQTESKYVNIRVNMLTGRKGTEAAKNEENVPVLPTGTTFPLSVAKHSCEKSFY